MQAKIPEPRFNLVICGAEYEMREGTDGTFWEVFGHLLAIFFGVALGWAVIPILLFFPRFWFFKFSDNQVKISTYLPLMNNFN